MPISYKHILYGCNFKCGNKHLTSYNAAENHELICWYNPDNRTCKTCWYEEFGLDKESAALTRWCTAPNGEEIITVNCDDIYVGGFVKPVEHCEAWEPL